MGRRPRPRHPRQAFLEHGTHARDRRAEDLLTPLSEGQKVAAEIPGARLHVFTGLGSAHTVLIERGPEFLGVVGGFLDEVRAPAHA